MEELNFQIELIRSRICGKEVDTEQMRAAIVDVTDSLVIIRDRIASIEERLGKLEYGEGPDDGLPS